MENEEEKHFYPGKIPTAQCEWLLWSKRKDDKEFLGFWSLKKFLIINEGKFKSSWEV